MSVPLMLINYLPAVFIINTAGKSFFLCAVAGKCEYELRHNILVDLECRALIEVNCVL